MALLLPLIVLAAFFLFRANPQKRRAQAQRALADSLRPGARVATVAGIIGTVVGVEGDRAALEIAPGVIVEFLLASITRTIDDEPVHPDAALGYDEDGSRTHGGAETYGSPHVDDVHVDDVHFDDVHLDDVHQDVGNGDVADQDVHDDAVHNEDANGADAPAADEHPAPHTKET
ncbi:MAG TPA: preprotein translocase subunit YajC [Acidimicrobiales bacterium]|nr:preprotein translocase subunit YajC [Acidimicrobiales bacterium]